MRKFLRKKIEAIKIKIRKKYIKITGKFRKKKINKDKFSIISNNCWAGIIYQSYNMKYLSPTIGMFIVASDYIKFISNLKYYLNIKKFEVVDPKDSKWYSELKNISNFGNYPIARLDDIELHLLHYKTIEEAQRKWNKRKKRVDYNNILYKFSEMNLCTKKNIQDFQSIKQKNKICFITKKYEKLKNEYTFVVSNNIKEQLKSSEEPFGHSMKVNINQIINKL